MIDYGRCGQLDYGRCGQRGACNKRLMVGSDLREFEIEEPLQKSRRRNLMPTHSTQPRSKNSQPAAQVASPSHPGM